MQKIYERINWENDPSTNTALGAKNLNKIDYALDEIDNRVVEMSAKVELLDSKIPFVINENNEICMEVEE